VNWVWASCDEVNQTDDKNTTLTVTIKPQKDRIRGSEQFKVDLRVVNSSKSPHAFRVRLGSWFEHSKTSNERFYVSGWPVSDNEEIVITLGPSRADEKTLAMLMVRVHSDSSILRETGLL
jgi:hypothetical protein